MTESKNTNLLVALHHWASRQDENFITDAFAHLLRRLLAEDGPAGIQLVRFLTDDRFPDIPNATAIIVRTQVTVAKGRPDIEISGLNHLIYVEAKVESGLGDRQLERYLEELDAANAPEASTLVVLSRYPVEITPSISHRVIAKRWYQVAHWLVEALGRGEVKNSVNQFLVEQLLEFFKTRNITMEKCESEMLKGVQAFRNLTAMVSEAIVGRQMTLKDSFGREWAGYYFDKTNQDFFLGVYYERLNVLVFETKNFPVVPDADQRLGFGKVSRVYHTTNKRLWMNELFLDSDEVKFFAQTREGQMQCIEKFLSDSLDAVARIREER